MSMTITEPKYDKGLGQYVVTICCDGSSNEYCFQDEADVDNFYRVNQVQLQQVNGEEDADR
jgi:hypothetical protein